MAGHVGVLLHVTEPIDPKLWEWLSDRIDHTLGISPETMIYLIGTFIVLFPIVLLILVWRQRRKFR